MSRSGEGQAEQVEGHRPLSVAELNRTLAALLERNLPPLWVRGEVSNFVRAASGHCYFTLKDEAAQVRAVMFRGRANALGFRLRDGDRLDAYGTVSMYQMRGDVQLVVEIARQIGGGDLYREFLRLRDKLQAEGLFAAARKRPVPVLPRCIGVVSSLNAAALRDVLTTLRRRAPHVPIVVYPCAVQGRDAPASLVAALRIANERRECDVLVLARGGGSIEDLWSFNDEKVVRAVAGSGIPVVAGVGHETDVTLADFAADLRAPTPTAAAAAAAVARNDLLSGLRAGSTGLSRALRRAQREAEQRLDAASRRLRPPSVQWARRAARVDALSSALRGAMTIGMRACEARVAAAGLRVRAPSTAVLVARLAGLSHRLLGAARGGSAARQGRLATAAGALELVSPTAVLDRGYAIVFDASRRVVADAASLAVGERIDVRLAHGSLVATVDESRAVEPAPGDMHPPQPGAVRRAGE